MAAAINESHWLCQRLLKQPDLSYVGPWLILSPVSHFARRLTIYDMVGEGGVYGVWSIQSLWAPLFPIELEDTIGFSTAAPPEGPIVISPAKMPRPITHDAFILGVESEILPLLRSIDSIDRFYREIVRKPDLVSDSPEARFCLNLAMGNFSGARKVMARRRDDWFEEGDDAFEEDEIEGIRQLCLLLDSDDRDAIARQLHRWEAAIAEYSGLEALWEPSPFPFEAGYENWVRTFGPG